jgi:signal transduction histidine kinase
MTHYEISAILTLVSTGLVAVLFALKDARRPLDRQYAIYLTAISTWAFTWLQMISSNHDASLFWARALHIPAVFIPAMFLHFSQTFLKIGDQTNQRRIRTLFYLLAPLFILPVFSPAYIRTVAPKQAFQNYLIPGPLYRFFTAYFVICVLVTFLILVREFLRSDRPRRKSIGYVLAAYAVGYAGGGTAFLPHFGIPMPKFSLYGVPLCQAIILYAIARHRLMNVSLFVRRAGTIIVIYAGLLLGVAPFILTIHQNLGLDGARSGWFFLEVILLGGALSTGPLIYGALARRTSWLQENQSKGLTHELRSPLSAIESAIDIMTEDIEKNASAAPRLRNYLRMVRDNATRLDLLVTDILAVANREGSMIGLNTDPVDLAKLVQETVESFRPVLAPKKLSINCSSSGDCRTIGDSKKLRQVVSNLVGNAAKFTHAGGIAVNVARINSHIECSVTDTGCGISTEDLPHVFQQYFQGKGATKGAGIGLAIARSWVEAHNGQIWIESTAEGKGTQVKFTIPVG